MNLLRSLLKILQSEEGIIVLLLEAMNCSAKQCLLSILDEEFF